MDRIGQIGAAVRISLKSAPQRLANSAVVIFGMAGVVAVLVLVLAMEDSLSNAVISTARSDRAIVLHNSSNTEIASVLSVEAIRTIVDKPGIARDNNGEPLASVDFVRGVNLPRRGDGSITGLTVRGTSPRIFDVRPELRMSTGRMFETGRREIIVGRVAQEEFSGVQLGDTVEMRDSQWTVVGTFESGDAFESSILVDIDSLLSAYQRSGGSSVTVLLNGEEHFDVFNDSISTDPSLSAVVTRESTFYAAQSEQLRNLLAAVSYFVGGIMAVGALFAALNTMYSSVRTRIREIATLRAMGFASASVVISTVSEAVVLALLGGILGATVASVLLVGDTVSMGDSMSTTVFELRVTASTLIIAIATACLVGIVGGLIPAAQAVRMSIATALRTN